MVYKMLYFAESRITVNGVDGKKIKWKNTFPLFGN